MSRTDRDLERMRQLLAKKLRESGAAHWQVEAALDWDRGRVAELLADVGLLQVDELLLILDAICVEPKDFWRELYSPLKKGGNGPG